MSVDATNGVGVTFSFEAILGRTRYQLVKASESLPCDQPAIEVRRTNEKETVIYVPESLLIAYAKLWVRQRFVNLLIGKVAL